VTGLADEVRRQIRVALRIAGVSQAELARRLALSEKHVSMMMTGKNSISLDMAERILGAAGCALAVWVVPVVPGQE